MPKSKQNIPNSMFPTTGDSSYSSSIKFTYRSHRNLSTWAENGVLMLNTCLTVQQGASNSHADKGWEKFTEYVIQMVDKYGGSNLPSQDASTDSGFGRGVVFLAWGAHAAKRVVKLDQVIFLLTFRSIYLFCILFRRST